MGVGWVTGSAGMATEETQIVRPRKSTFNIAGTPSGDESNNQ